MKGANEFCTARVEPRRMAGRAQFSHHKMYDITAACGPALPRQQPFVDMWHEPIPATAVMANAPPAQPGSDPPTESLDWHPIRMVRNQAAIDQIQ